jgi:hypothetical protein
MLLLAMLAMVGAAMPALAQPYLARQNNLAAVTYSESGKQRIYVFACGDDGHVYVNYWDGSRWQWADQGTPPGTTAFTGLAAITYREAGTQRIYAFVGGANGHLYVNYWDGSRWQWADQGTPPNSSVSLAPGANTFSFIAPNDLVARQQIYVFVSGSNGHLFLNYWNGFQWQWRDQGSPTGSASWLSPPGVTSYSTSGRPGVPSERLIYAFVGSSNGHLYVNYWNGATWQWADQGTPPGGFAACTTKPAVITYNEARQQRLYVFTDDGCFSSNGHLYVNYWDGNRWQWADQGKPFTTATSKAIWAGATTYAEYGTQHIFAFVRGLRADGINELCLNYWNGSWWQWEDRGPWSTGNFFVGILGAPEVISYLDPVSLKPQVFAFAVGSDSKLYVHCQIGGAKGWFRQGP